MGEETLKLNWKRVSWLAGTGLFLYVAGGFWWALRSPPPQPPRNAERPLNYAPGGLTFLSPAIRQLQAEVARIAKESRAEYQSRGEPLSDPILRFDRPPDSPHRALIETIRAYGADTMYFYPALDVLSRLREDELAIRLLELYTLPSLKLHLSARSNNLWARHVPELSEQLQRLLADGESFQRCNAARLLGALPPPAAEELDQFLELLHDEDPLVRANISPSLVQWEGQQAFQPLTDTLLAEQIPEVRAALVYALALTRHPQAPEVLEGYLFDEKQRVRIEAAIALGQLRAAESVAALGEALLPDTSWQEPNLYAAAALGAIATPDAVRYLLTGLESDASDIRSHCAMALGDARATEAVAALAQILRDSSRRVRLHAVLALQSIGDARIVPILIDAIGKEKDAQVRTHMIRAISELGEPAQAEKILLHALRDRDQLVRFQAVMEVRDLGLVHLPQIEEQLRAIRESDGYPALRVAARRVLEARPGPGVPAAPTSDDLSVRRTPSE